jgi:hypothetical protein
MDSRSSRVDREVVTQEGASPDEVSRTSTQSTVSSVRVSGNETIRRVVVLAAGLIQILIISRIVLLLLDARTANDLVSGILNVSNVFVAPFNGILQTNSLTAAGSVLDVAAVVALVGWTILEVIIFWSLSIFSRQSSER